MRWEIQPLEIPPLLVNNKSSRLVDKSVPINGALSLTGSLSFTSSVLGAERHVWLTFTNSGTKQLKELELLLPRNFEYYGTVPTVLDAGDHFIIRLSYNPTRLGAITGKLYIKAHKVMFEFPFSANVT